MNIHLIRNVKDSLCYCNLAFHMGVIMAGNENHVRTHFVTIYTYKCVYIFCNVFGRLETGSDW
jgi:hypothetical protein